MEVNTIIVNFMEILLVSQIAGFFYFKSFENSEESPLDETVSKFLSKKKISIILVLAFNLSLFLILFNWKRPCIRTDEVFNY
jgi:hypothetical protein